MSKTQGSLTKLLKSAGIVFVSTVVARGLALGAEVFIIRSLSPDVFGTIAVAYTVALVLGRLSLFGVPAGVTRFISDESSEEEQWTVVKHGLLIVAPLTVTASLVLIVFPASFGELMNSEGIKQYLTVFALFVVAFPISRVIIAVLRARGETLYAGLSKDLLSRAGGIVLFAGLASVGITEVGAVAYWVSLPIISMVSSVYLLNRRLSVSGVLKSTIDWSSLRDLWSFSWPLAFSSSLLLFFSNMDVLMIEYFLASEAVGYYRSIQPLRQVTGFVLSSFTFLYLPLATQYFSNGDFDTLAEFYKVTTKWITALTLPLVLVFSVFAADIVKVFFGPAYLPVSEVLSVLVGGLFFNVLVGPNGATAKAIDRPRIELVSAAVGFVVNLGLNIILIPRYGIMGAAVATVAGFVTYNTMEITFIRRSIGCLPFSANQLKPLAPTVGAALLLKWFFGGSVGFAGLIAIGMFLSAFHLVSMLVTRSIDENDIDLVRRLEENLGREIPYIRGALNRFSKG
ncbi:flippase [Halopelagius longus]|uniref:flippase n=1 Tax=Halopelagius longus TaxID=1236180 RepID=UPI00158792B4|nr:flippase [Halopelagius longus]